MNRPVYQTIVMIIGVITALVVVFSQVFFFQGAGFSTPDPLEATASAQPDTPFEEEQPADQAGHGTFISLPSTTVLSSFQTTFQHPAILLFEVVFDDEEPTHFIPERSVFLGKYFQTLFHIIISPNAP